MPVTLSIMKNIRINICWLLLVFTASACSMQCSLGEQSREKLATIGSRLQKGFNVNNVISSKDGRKIAWFDHVNKLVVFACASRVSTYDSESCNMLCNLPSSSPQICCQLIFDPLNDELYLKSKKSNKEKIIHMDNNGIVKEEPPYDEVSFLTFGPKPDQFAYVAKENGQKFVVLNGQEHAKYADIDGSSLQFSKDSYTVAYIATKVSQTLRESQRQCVVLNNQEQPTYCGISHLALSPDGNRASYAVTQNARESFLVRDGFIDNRYNYAKQITYSPDGKHVVFVVGQPIYNTYRQTPGCRSGEIFSGQFVVQDDCQISKNYEAIDSLRYLSSGELVFIARKDGEIFLVSNNKETGKIKIDKNSGGLLLDGPILEVIQGNNNKQFIFKDYPCPLVNGGEPILSKDRDHIAYFDYSRKTANSHILYIDGKEAKKGDPLISTSNWNNMASIDTMESRFAKDYSRIVIQNIFGEEKVGRDFDWVSQPILIRGDSQNFVYIALDRDTFWRIVTKF